MKFVNYAIVSLLVYVGFRLGVGLSDLIYYDVLNEHDPFAGPTTFRVALESFCFGMVSSVFGLLYLAFFKIKFKVSYFVVSYSLAILTLIAVEVRLMSGFPLSLEFWFYTVATFTSIASIMVYLYYLAQKKLVQKLG